MSMVFSSAAYPAAAQGDQPAPVAHKAGAEENRVSGTRPLLKGRV